MLMVNQAQHSSTNANGTASGNRSKKLIGDTKDIFFGRSVAISGTYCIVGDNDAEDTRNPNASGKPGAAFIYERQRNGDWKQVKKVIGDNKDVAFGRSVAISGNYCIVGDLGAEDTRNASTNNPGAAFIYERQRNGDWKQVKKLIGDTKDVFFGRSVAISGNYCIVGDEDAIDTRNPSETKPGAAFIYERQRNGEWKQVKKVIGDTKDVEFGYSVAISGNYCIVGDYAEDTRNPTKPGAAFIYERQRNGEWKQVKKVIGDTKDVDFGQSVAISGTYCIVGDYNAEDTRNPSANANGKPGAAFIYERQRNGDWKQVKKLIGDTKDVDFGISVAISGNYCIVGDRNANDTRNPNDNKPGAAFIYELKLV